MNGTHLISLATAADRPVALGLAVRIGAARVLGAGVRVAADKRIAGVAGRTATDGAIA
jgi:hypothetical protein